MKFFYTVLFCLIYAMSFSQNDGDLDLTFNGDGIANFVPGTGHDVLQAIATTPEGKIVACGVSSGSAIFNFDIAIMRANADGSLDTDFGTNGYYLHDFNSESDFLYDLEILDNGKILACGAMSVTIADTDILVVRLNEDGTLDETFGGGDGFAIIPIYASEDYANAMEITDNGDILLAGSSVAPGSTTTKAFVMKLDSEGELDATFGTGGTTLVELNEYAKFEDIAEMSDGSIVVCGSTDINFSSKGWVTKFSAGGIQDLTFGVTGNYLAPTNYGTAYGILAEANRLVICGMHAPSETNAYITALTSLGAPDETFGTSGTTLVDVDASDVALDVIAQADGKYIIAGSSGTGIFTRDFFAARITSAGTPDPDFGTDGIVVFSIGSSFDEVNACSLDEDGKILLAGFSAGTNNDMVIARLENTVEVVEYIQSQKESKFELYPNPFSESFLITGYEGQIVCMEVMNSIGEICFSQSGNFNQNINLSHLKGGMYWVKLLFSDNTQSHRMIVKS